MSRRRLYGGGGTGLRPLLCALVVVLLAQRQVALGDTSAAATSTAPAVVTNVPIPNQPDDVTFCGPPIDGLFPEDPEWQYDPAWGQCDTTSGPQGACCSFACSFAADDSRVVTAAELGKPTSRCKTMGEFSLPNGGCFSQAWEEYCDGDAGCLPQCLCSRALQAEYGYVCVPPRLPPTPEPTPGPPPTIAPSKAPTPMPTFLANPCFLEQDCSSLPKGQETCPCRNTEPRCDAGLVCSSRNQCVNCPLGEAGCPCKLDGTCNPGMQCNMGACVGVPGQPGALGRACRAPGEASIERVCNQGLFCNFTVNECQLCGEVLGEIGCTCDQTTKFCYEGTTCNVPLQICSPCPDGCLCPPPRYRDDPCAEASCEGCPLKEGCRFCNAGSDYTCVSELRPCPSGKSPKPELSCGEYDCEDVDNCGGPSVGECTGPNQCLCLKGMFTLRVGCVVPEVEGCFVGETSCSVFIGAGIALVVVAILIGVGIAIVRRRDKKRHERKKSTRELVRKKSSRRVGMTRSVSKVNNMYQEANAANNQYENVGGGNGWDAYNAAGTGYYDQNAFFSQMQQQWGGYGTTAGGYGDASAAYGGVADMSTQAIPTEVSVNFQDVTREQAELALKGAAPGSYLIRPSSRESCLSLSFKDHATNAVQHMLLVKTDQGWQKEDDGLYFEDISSLLRDGLADLKLDLKQK